jgi:hypothetical protein
MSRDLDRVHLYGTVPNIISRCSHLRLGACLITWLGGPATLPGQLAWLVYLTHSRTRLLRTKMCSLSLSLPWLPSNRMRVCFFSARLAEALTRMMESHPDSCLSPIAPSSCLRFFLQMALGVATSAEPSGAGACKLLAPGLLERSAMGLETSSSRTERLDEKLATRLV